MGKIQRNDEGIQNALSSKVYEEHGKAQRYKTTKEEVKTSRVSSGYFQSKKENGLGRSIERLGRPHKMGTTIKKIKKAAKTAKTVKTQWRRRVRRPMQSLYHGVNRLKKMASLPGNQSEYQDATQLFKQGKQIASTMNRSRKTVTTTLRFTFKIARFMVQKTALLVASAKATLLLPMVMAGFLLLGGFMLVSSTLKEQAIAEEHQYKESDYLFPLPKEFSSVSAHYGRYAPFGEEMEHRGTDFPAPIGTPVVAIADGVVIEATEYLSQQGLKVVGIVHQNPTLTSRYMHLSRIDVKVGQSVKQGQLIGLTGNTGFSTGPHLHFQVEKDSTQGLNKTHFDARHIFPQLLGKSP